MKTDDINNMIQNMVENDIVYRLKKRAEIRRQIPGRRSVVEGKPDRISDLLDEAAEEILRLRREKNLREGADIHSDKGYSIGTTEGYEEFVRMRTGDKK
jgi:hypothetical protein